MDTSQFNPCLCSSSWEDITRCYAAGPDNPLGDYALSLSWANYLIHGTNKQKTVGLRSSSGCIRMYDKDIKELFYLVKKGNYSKFYS